MPRLPVDPFQGRQGVSCPLTGRVLHARWLTRISVHLSLQPHEVGTVLNLILQLRNLQKKEVRYLPDSSC